MQHKFSIVTTARWEKEAITEWIVYHRSIGFSHIYVYCNDDDPTGLYEALLPFLGENPFVTFVHFGLQGQQRQMLLHFLKKHRHETKWIAFFDVDEFLNIVNTNSIADFIEQIGQEIDGIYFNWVFFGNNGFKTRPSGSVLKNYTRRQATLHPFTKVMLKTKHFTEKWVNSNPTHAFWHDIGDLLGPLKLVNAIGEPCTTYYHDFPQAAQKSLTESRSTQIFASALLHHYTIKSELDFIRRFERGVKGDFRKQVGWKELAETGGAQAFLDSTNEVVDASLSLYWTDFIEKAWEASIIALPSLPNVALNKPATQSSIADWSIGLTPELDASRAVNGDISGGAQCHTGADTPSWWQINLLSQTDIHEIRIFNRLDMAMERMCKFRISVSDDGFLWSTIFEKLDDKIFGGADGNPFIWKADTRLLTTFVRITLLTPDYLNLDQVEVYGTAQSEATR